MLSLCSDSLCAANLSSLCVVQGSASFSSATRSGTDGDSSSSGGIADDLLFLSGMHGAAGSNAGTVPYGTGGRASHVPNSLTMHCAFS